MSIQKPESLTEKNIADVSTLTTPNGRNPKCDPDLASKKISVLMIFICQKPPFFSVSFHLKFCLMCPVGICVT